MNVQSPLHVIYLVRRRVHIVKDCDCYFLQSWLAYWHSCSTDISSASSGYIQLNNQRRHSLKSTHGACSSQSFSCSSLFNMDQWESLPITSVSACSLISTSCLHAHLVYLIVPFASRRLFITLMEGSCCILHGELFFHIANLQYWMSKKSI